MRKGGDAEIDWLAMTLIAVAFVVVGALLYFGLSGKLSGMGDFLRNFLGLGR